MGRGGKLAVTHIEKVEPIGEFSIVTCRLETGRTHQIRIHLAELGHPVIGDPVYSEVREPSERLALHAAELGFTHPATGERMNWTMPMPNELQAVIHRPGRERN